MPLFYRSIISAVLFFLSQASLSYALDKPAELKLTHSESGSDARIPLQFSGKDLSSGKIVSIHLNKVTQGTVILFLSSRCPCSNAHIPAVQDLAAQFKSPEFQFVGINSNANEEADDEINKTKDYFKRLLLSFPVLGDPSSKIADQLGAKKTPHAFLINPQGKILFQGGIDESHSEKGTELFLKNALLAVKAGKEPEKKEARAVGCIIKRP